ncbi:hypothetical protein ABZX12_14810 [Kribbella sp. NPDC003505]|uniref:hypothetical protein n=1 Tax=Kribbella sp. NPDC003505 TaxID=3154448 RepID=UPI0033A00E36
MVTVVATWTGAKASALRVALRLTMEELADQIGGMSPRGVAKWDHQPDIVPTMASQRDLDHMLKSASGDELARFEMLLGEMSPRDMPERQIAEQVLPVLQAPTPLTSARGVFISPTSDTLAWFEQNLRNQYTADNLLGPRTLMPLMKSYVDTLENWQQDARGPVLDRLLRVGAGYAEFTGWLHHDAGDQRGGATWESRALEWAQVGMDDRMASFVMMRRAAAALAARRGTHAVRYAQAAQKYQSPETGRVRIIAAATEAHGHAIDGNGSEVDRVFDIASGLVESYGDEIFDGDPTADRYCEPGLYVKIARAKCALELQRASEAIAAFTDVLNNLPADYHRDRGRYLGSLANAHILAEEPEAAVAAAEEAYTIAIATGSSRTLSSLRETLPSGLARWLHIPDVERFCAMIAAVEPEIGGN